MVPEEWSNCSVDDCVVFSGGSQPPRSTFAYKPKDGYVRLVQTRDYRTDKYATYIPKNLAKKHCHESDVMIGRYGPPVFQIFRGLAGAYNVALIKASPRSNTTKDFIFYFLSNDRLHRAIDALSRRSAGQAGVEMDFLKSYPFPLPPMSEQERIVEMLSTWDKAIETTEKLIDNSKTQKKALMQQLLTGQRRYSQFIDSKEKRETKYGDLPMDWSFLPISDIALERNERAGKNAELPVLSCSKYDGFVDSLQYFKKKVYSDDTSNYKVVRRGCYGFPSNHIEEGSIGYQDICTAGIVSPIYSVFETSEQVHDGYMFRLLKTEHYRQIFQARTNASVDRRGSLRWKEFGKIYVPLPSFAEQQKISETIDIAENEFANLSAQHVRLQAQKRALIQQLLTGKRRVKVAA